MEVSFKLGLYLVSVRFTLSLCEGILKNRVYYELEPSVSLIVADWYRAFLLIGLTFGDVQLVKLEAQ